MGRFPAGTSGTGVALPSVRFVGGHHDEPDLFDLECSVLRLRPAEIVLQPRSVPAVRIILNSRYVGKAIGLVDGTTETTICTFRFEDDSHRGMASWSRDEHGRVVVRAYDY
jgi:hypothetical protein